MWSINQRLLRQSIVTRTRRPRSRRIAATILFRMVWFASSQACRACGPLTQRAAAHIHSQDVPRMPLFTSSGWRASRMQRCWNPVIRRTTSWRSTSRESSPHSWISSMVEPPTGTMMMSVRRASGNSVSRYSGQRALNSPDRQSSRWNSAHNRSGRIFLTRRRNSLRSY